MNKMRVIPTRAHGVLDYLVGVLLVASPWIFGFSDDSEWAKGTFLVLGILVIATSLMTNYELGVMHVLPMHLHLGADAVVGLALALSPWILGYADDAGGNGWVPAVVIGLGELLVVALSDPWPQRDDVAARERRLVKA